jgi:hypothetical protein
MITVLKKPDDYKADYEVVVTYLVEVVTIVKRWNKCTDILTNDQYVSVTRIPEAARQLAESR